MVREQVLAVLLPLLCTAGAEGVGQLRHRAGSGLQAVHEAIEDLRSMVLGPLPWDGHRLPWFAANGDRDIPGSA